MKKKSAIKKILSCIGYVLIAIFLLASISILIQKSSSRENGSIVKAQDSDTYFKNSNPKFSVDFVNGEYIRFESIKSYRNPFEETEVNLWEKIKYYLGLEKKKLGLQLTLEEISYDDEISKLTKEQSKELSLNKTFELIQSGRAIADSGSGAVSKDTVVSRNVYKGVNIEYQIVEGKGLKEEIVLEELPEYSVSCDTGECILPANRYVFKISLDEGLQLKRSITSLPGFPSGTQYITDEKGNYFAHFLPEFAVDAVGNKTSEVYISITNTEKKNEYTYELVLDSKWLLSEERVFPIRIDPSIVHDSSLSFDIGSYERTMQDQTSTVRLGEFLSGEYTSAILPLGDSAVLDSITWSAFGSATGNGEIPYSNIGLLLEENFNDTLSNVKKWGEGVLELNGSNTSKSFNINSTQSTYFSVEFWVYNRYRSQVIEEKIFSSNLVSLIVKDGTYVLLDNQGVEYQLLTKLSYNQWKHIALVLDITDQSLTFYLDGKEEKIPFSYGSSNTLASITLGGQSAMYGYIDTLRAYSRLLTSYEVISNTQYANLYLQYRNSSNQNSWSEWKNNLEYLPNFIQEDDNVEILSEEEDFSKYNLLSFQYLSDGSSDIYVRSKSVKETNSNNDPIEYIDFIFTPTSLSNLCLLSVGDLSIYSNSQGAIGVRSGTQEFLSKDSYILNQSNHIAFKEGYLYVNGNISTSEALSGSLGTGEYTLAVGCSESFTPATEQEVNNIRLSSFTDIDVYEMANIQNLKYTYKPAFKANLQSSSTLSSASSKTFSIKEIGSTTNYIDNLNIEDLIVLQEEISDQKYFVEGEVISVNKDTGHLEVKEWIGEFPQSGFTEDVNISKWQREYISISNYLDTSKEINSISLLIDSQKSKIKDIKLISGITERDSIFPVDFDNQYLQYRYIFTSKLEGLTSYLSTVNINYTVAGPSMEQIMRHGSWFDNGKKESFWWAK